MFLPRFVDAELAPPILCSKGCLLALATKNRLKDSASPYLRSAAHQPIDWFEWGEDAFGLAKLEDKPILLDIGAVWCHWCHVIDRESYENAEIAKIINEHFVAVKVDRDERPDVDARYQSAISALSGQGGWPLTGFLLPDGKPFYGGTYFPPDDQGGRPGFRRVLLAVADSYRNKRPDLERAANSLADAVAQAETFNGARAKFDLGVVDAQIQSLTKLFDIRNGGFGQSPKFAHASAIELLLERYQETKEKHLLAMAETIIGWVNDVLSDQRSGGFYASQDADYCLSDDGD